MQSLPLRKHDSSRGPSLQRNYPPSSLLWPPPTSRKTSGRGFRRIAPYTVPYDGRASHRSHEISTVPSHHLPCVPSLSTPGMTGAVRTRYPRPLLPLPAMRRLGHPFPQATQCIGPESFTTPLRVPLWYGPQVRLSSLAGAWTICRITPRTQVAPRLRSQANELRVIARGRTLHLPDKCESRPELIASPTKWRRAKRGHEAA